MKKLFLPVFMLALIVSSPWTQAKKNEELPSGSRCSGGLCTDQFRPRPAKAMSLEEQAKALANPPFPYEDTFLLHSYPSSNQKLFIDFDGHRRYSAWDTDGDIDTFSDAERLVIQLIWYSVSEDFLPFNIDVTTEEPGPGFTGMRAVIDGAEIDPYSWAYMGVWPDSEDFCIIDPADDTWLWIATAVSHEVGHTLDLYDHGQTDGTGYYMGHGTGWTMWGAIMGWDSDSLGVWDDGDYPIPNHPEDSTAIIVGPANPGVDFRADDHGSTTDTATAVDITQDLIVEGIIEQRTDVDYFSFAMSTAGDVAIAINGDVTMGASNLDVLAKLHDSDGAVLSTSNPVDRIWATFNETLAAGDYYISVDGTGYDDPDGHPSEGFGYSDYGILGYYSIKKYTGSLDPPTPDPMTFASPPAATGTSSIEMTASVATDEDGVDYYFECTNGGGHDSGWQSSPYYEDGGLTPDTEYTYRVYARDDSVMQNQTAASADTSATTDSGLPVINLALPGYGGVLESYSSQYSVAFAATLLTNNVANENGWASEANPGPQEFVYSFLDGQNAILYEAVIHGGLAEGSYYSKDVEVWSSADGSTFTFLGSDTLLDVANDSVTIDLGGISAKKVKLVITSGYRTDYWDLAEFEVHGSLVSGGGSGPRQSGSRHRPGK